MEKIRTLSVILKDNIIVRWLLCSLLAIVLPVAFLIAKSSLGMGTGLVKEAQASIAPTVPPKSYDLPDIDNFVDIPYFINSGDMTSTLVLNNDLPNVAQAEVTLFNRQGEPLKLPAFTLQPLNAERFNLAGFTSEAAGDFSSGNIQIFYHAPMMSITSQVTVGSTSKKISFESNASSAMDYHSNQLSAIIWLADDETQAKAALTNTTSSPLTVAAQAGREIRTIILGARETQVVELRDFVAATTDGPLVSLLTLKHSGAPGALVATGFAYNERKGFSTNLPFVDRSTMATKTLAGAHFKFGPAAFNAGLPWGTTFQVPLVLANPSSSPILANVTVDYTLNAVAHRVALRSISLAAKQIKQIDLAQELANRGLTGPVDDAGIQISYTGQPGALMARLTSMDETGDFVFDTPLKDPLAGMFRVSGNYPWRLDGDYNTVVHLKNTTNKEVYAVAQLRYEGGDYNPDKIKLAPYQTVALDIKKLRDGQAKDIRGGVMPPEVTSGQILWYEQTLDSLIGRAELFTIADGLSSSFSCGGPGVCGQSFATASANPSSANKTADDTGVFFTAQETDRDCLSATFGPFSVTSGLTWSSTDESVAVVDASSGFVRCMSGGSAAIKATWSATVYNCGMSCNSIPVNPVAAGTLQVKPKITSISPSRAPQAFGSGLNITITGKGFGSAQANVTLTIAGSGVTGQIDRVTPQEILATFTVADDAAAGNHGVTVKVRNQTSNSVNFFVQIPTKIRRDSLDDITTCDPNRCTIGQIQNACGAYRVVHYTLVDQANPSQPIAVPCTVTETVTNLSDNSQITKPISTNEAGQFDDLLALFKVTTCPSPGESASVRQTFTAKVGNKTFNLTTTNRIDYSKSTSGTYSISITVETP